MCEQYMMNYNTTHHNSTFMGPSNSSNPLEIHRRGSSGSSGGWSGSSGGWSGSSGGSTSPLGH